MRDLYDKFVDIQERENGGILDGSAFRTFDGCDYHLSEDGLCIEICCQRCGKLQQITFSWEELADVANYGSQAKGWRQARLEYLDTGEDDWCSYEWRCKRRMSLPKPVPNVPHLGYIDDRYEVECGGYCEVTIGKHEARHFVARAAEKGWCRIARKLLLEVEVEGEASGE